MRPSQAIGLEIEFGAHLASGDVRRNRDLTEALARANEQLFGPPRPAERCGCGSGLTEFSLHEMRIYIDHLHLEAATPLVLSAASLVGWQKKAMAAAMAVKRGAETILGEQVVLHTAATNRAGVAWGGCHLNVLLARQTFDHWRSDGWRPLNGPWIPFLISGPILFGTGKLGAENGGRRAKFQLSERADFITQVSALETVSCKSLINERDEPLADPSRFARFHIAAPFDGNLMPYATWLKAGAVQLLLALTAAGAKLPDLRLRRPLRSLAVVSRDLTFRRKLRLEDGRRMTALEIQSQLAEAAAGAVERGEVGEETVPGAAEIARQWIASLDMLRRRDFARLSRRLDWVARKRLLDETRRKLGLRTRDRRLAVVDLRYGELHGGLFELLDQGGLVDHLEDFLPTRPANGDGVCPRCTARAVLIHKFGPCWVTAISWTGVCLMTGNDDEHIQVILDDPFETEVLRAVEAATSPSDLVRRLPAQFSRKAACRTHAESPYASLTSKEKDDGHA